MAQTKTERRNKIKARIRSRVSGTATKPRLSVFRRNKQIYAQLIDDVNGVTLAFASSRSKEIAGSSAPKGDQATLVGKNLAEIATSKGISEVVFDRNGYLYHGRIKNLAEGAREGGLKF